MITDVALSNYYQVQPVYFWDAPSSHLVPDVRYLPYGLARRPAGRPDRAVAGRRPVQLADRRPAAARRGRA